VYGAGSQDDQNGYYTIHYDPHFPPGWIDNGVAKWQLGNAANPNCIKSDDGNDNPSIWSYKFDVNEFSCTLAAWNADVNGGYHFFYQSSNDGPDGAGHAYEGNLPEAASLVCLYCWGDGVYSPNDC
jgi:hypothetical protein